MCASVETGGFLALAAFISLACRRFVHLFFVTSSLNTNKETASSPFSAYAVVVGRDSHVWKLLPYELFLAFLFLF